MDWVFDIGRAEKQTNGIGVEVWRIGQTSSTAPHNILGFSILDAMKTHHKGKGGIDTAGSGHTAVENFKTSKARERPS